MTAPRSYRLPPLRTCLGCGAVFRGYSDACRVCREAQSENSSALRVLLRERRLQRAAERDRDHTDGVERGA